MNKKENNNGKQLEREKVSYPVEKEQKMLKSSFDMYEKSISDTIEHMKNDVDKTTGERKYSDADIEDRIHLLKEAESDIIDKYVENGGSIDELKGEVKKMKFKKMPDFNLLNRITEVSNVEEDKIDNNIESSVNERLMSQFIPTQHATGSNATYDIISLPSKGQCYPDKIDKIPVSYLTAYDENIIISPNLYRENLVIDYILNEKIMNDEIDPSKLLDGDRDAIIIYLRAAGYGNEYPITVTDDITGQEFDTVIDLSDLKFKDFNLVGDENGLFDFELPVSKNKIKFRFLNHFDNQSLIKINDIEKKNAYKGRINEMLNTMDSYLGNMDEIAFNDKKKVEEHIKGLREWSNSLKDSDKNEFTHSLTNKLELSIMEVDGNKDRAFIRDFVNSMNVKDSSALRKYINANEPGIDYNIDVKKPESLGGGSMKVFLELDQFIFLNVSE